jgi:hypothetical protein
MLNASLALTQIVCEASRTMRELEGKIKLRLLGLLVRSATAAAE